MQPSFVDIVVLIGIVSTTDQSTVMELVRDSVLNEPRIQNSLNPRNMIDPTISKKYERHIRLIIASNRAAENV